MLKVANTKQLHLFLSNLVKTKPTVQVQQHDLPAKVNTPTRTFSMLAFINYKQD